MDIKGYWNERASADTAAPTTNDVFLRKLERATLIAHLRRLGCNRDSRVLDAGCGDGGTLFALAEALGCTLTGSDYSTAMIDLALQKLAGRPNPRLNFSLADVREIGTVFAPESFDFVSTDRCLINLESNDEQFAAIEALADLLRPAGYYLAIENFIEGNDRDPFALLICDDRLAISIPTTLRGSADRSFNIRRIFSAFRSSSGRYART
jgi:ubiquinone/menaquinone biosynthesis C-methylase UbiE